MSKDNTKPDWMRPAYLDCHVAVKHTAMVKALKKNPTNILHSLDSSKCDLLHMGIGIVGEAGELIDAIKKHVMYNKPLDRENVVEELGDIEFYLQGLYQSLNISRAECLAANIGKLAVRYSEGAFSDKQAATRADKLRPDLPICDDKQEGK